MTTHAAKQLEAIYQKPLTDLSEGEIVSALKAWDDEDNFLPIVELVDELTPYQQTPVILSEQARACNNVFWADKSEKNRAYLERAVAILSDLEPIMGDDKSWHYKIGYAYFYLNNQELATKHLTISQDYNNEDDLLTYLRWAKEKGISTLVAEAGGEGGIAYELDELKALLAQKAPKVLASFNPPASKTELAIFEHKIGVKLPESFWQFYRTFNGQQFGATFCDGIFGHFLSLEEILLTQEQVLDRLKEQFKGDWDTRTPYATKFPYDPSWVPVAVFEHDDDDLGLMCLDLDKSSPYYNELILVALNDDPAAHEVAPEHSSLRESIRHINHLIYHDQMVYDDTAHCLIHPDPIGEASLTHHYTEADSLTLQDYVAHTFGAVDKVLSDELADVLSCQILVIKPTNDTPYYTLITHGMGAYPMHTPDDDTPKYAELLIRVPSDWQIDSDDENYYWVIRTLRQLAYYPLTEQNYLASGRTLPTQGGIANTKFESLLFLEADDQNYDIARVKLPSGNVVVFYQVIPLYKQELQYKLDMGNMALMQRLEEAGIPYPPVVDTHRPNVCLGYQHDTGLSVFDGVFWSFHHKRYETVDEFEVALFDYNAKLNNPLDDFAAQSILFDTPLVYLTYRAWLRGVDELHGHEFLEDPSAVYDHFVQADDTPYLADIIATITAETGGLTALSLLWQLHNSLANKELGGQVFFEGFEKVGVVSDDDEDVPVIEVRLGN